MRLLRTIVFCLITWPLIAQPIEQENPPNTIQVDDNLYIDKTEIVNLHWLEYLHYLAKDSGQTAMQLALPDTSVWLTFGDTLRWRHYLRYPGYRYFPVVGITLRQARNYCTWRSAVVTAKLSGKAFHYRLPTETEWMKAAAASLDVQEFPYGYQKIYGPTSLSKRKGREYFKKVTQVVTYDVFKQDLVEYIKSNEEIVFNVIKNFKDYFQYGDYAPSYIFDKRTPANLLGLHHMIGNVAEMTDQPGIAKGGSWFHYPDEGEITKQILYFKPEAWLGFRCVCEVAITN